MDTKLTLKLDRSIIESIKRYAETHNRSLSQLVEDYFRNLIADPDQHSEVSPLVRELSGVISEKDVEKLDYISYLEHKYE